MSKISNQVINKPSDKVFVDWEIEAVIFELEKRAFEKAYQMNEARRERGLHPTEGLEVKTLEYSALRIIRQLQATHITTPAPTPDIQINLPPIVDKPIPKRRKKES